MYGYQVIVHDKFADWRPNWKKYLLQMTNPLFTVVFLIIICSNYMTTHVAAQYGQTAFLYHIVMKWNVDPDVLDDDGRSPLHCVLIHGGHSMMLRLGRLMKGKLQTASRTQ